MSDRIDTSRPAPPADDRSRPLSQQLGVIHVSEATAAVLRRYGLAGGDAEQADADDDREGGQADG